MHLPRGPHVTGHDVRRHPREGPAPRALVDAVHREGAAIFIQLGHGGLYSMEAWHEPYASTAAGPLLAASPPAACGRRSAACPCTSSPPRRSASSPSRYGEVAAWGREAGYDGIQLGSANAKLLDQLLSPFYNRRTDEFGGSLERRASVLRLHPRGGRRASRRRLSRAR